MVCRTGATEYGAWSVGTGRIVKFDRLRGFGFIEPDDGTDDVFVYAAEVGWGDDPVPIGARVEYSAVNGERGLRAAGARLIAPVAVARAGGLTVAPRAHDAAVVKVDAAVAAKVGEETVDVLSTAAYAAEITEVLMAILPEVTAAQIIAVRQRLVGAAFDRGWLDTGQAVG